MKVITLVGNITKDAEVRHTQGGNSVCGFTIAVNDRRANETYYFECNYWGKAGQGVSPYLTKGKQVTVMGDFSWREYNEKKYLQVNVNSLQLGQANRDNNYSQDLNGRDPDGGDKDPFSDEIPF